MFVIKSPFQPSLLQIKPPLLGSLYFLPHPSELCTKHLLYCTHYILCSYLNACLALFMRASPGKEITQQGALHK